MLRIAGIQHDIEWEQPDANFASIGDHIARAAGIGTDLIVVSEMFSTGFSMNTEVVAEGPDGPSFSFLVDQAGHHGVTLCGSIPTRFADRELPVNRLVVVDGNGLIGDYAKIHPFSFSGEDQHYEAGDSFMQLELAGVRCTFFVCYDLRFADEFWVNAASTDLFVVPANWPAGRRRHWQTLLRARAIENQAYVLGVNRVGDAGPVDASERLAHSGDSMLIDPLGETLASASGIETIISGTIDAAVVADVRARFPFHADRR